MTEYHRRYRWAMILAVLLLSIASGFVAYNVGLSHGHGLAQGAGAQSGSVQNLYPYGYGWHRPWGFGFGFPLFFFVFWILLFRGLWWGGPWRRHWYAGGPQYLHGEGSGVPPEFDEWHRRAHTRMKETPPEDNPGSGR